MKIYILRHAQTHYNAARILQGHKNSLLNPGGEAQARSAGERLADIPFDAVFGSDLVRCKDTAEIILEQNRTDCEPIVQFSPNFRERAMGELEGMSVDDAQHFCHVQGKTFHDYGESSHHALARMLQGFKNVVNTMEEKHIEHALLVSHGSVIPRLLKSLLHHNLLSCGEFSETSIRVPHNTAITVLEKEDGQWLLRAVNDTSHLSSVAKVDSLVL